MAENKDYETIIREITLGLTGEPQKDKEYLLEQMERYKDHELGKEIVRACGRIMYEIMPEDKKAELEKIINKDTQGIEAALDEVKFNVYKKNYDKALELIESIIKTHEESGWFAEDSVSEYYCFKEPMEELLFAEYNKSEKDVRKATIDFSEMYFLYGCLLNELQRYQNAEEALRKAMKWNPVSLPIAYELAEAYKAQGNIEDFKDFTIEMHKYVFRPDDMARFYRNLSYYFVEKEEYETAVCCLLFSERFANSDMVQSELYYIMQKSGKDYDPSVDDLKRCFETHVIPLGPDDEMLKIAFVYGRKMYEDQDLYGAGYFLSLFSAYIDDDEVEKMLEDINAKLESKEN